MEQIQDKQIHLPSQPSITRIKALKYIKQHKKPLVKLELCKSKFVVPSNPDDETRNLHSAFEALKEVLDYVRVDRRWCTEGVACFCSLLGLLGVIAAKQNTCMTKT